MGVMTYQPDTFDLEKWHRADFFPDSSYENENACIDRFYWLFY